MNTTAQPLVSVVTPVYNEAGHLAECIESVMAQTYQNWDYTILDNCSTDGTAEIARRYAAKDPRIRLVQNKEHLLATPNFNVALRQISPDSKYCKIVLGDDLIFPECLKRMIEVAEKHPSVAFVTSYALAGHEVKWTGLPYPSTVVSGREICRKTLLENLSVFGSETSFLYRADLVRARNPFYNDANVHADTETCFDLLKDRDFGFVHQVLTYTRMRPGSLSTISASLHTDYGHILHTIVKYGPDFLTRAEYDQCLKSFVASYYRVLAKNVLLRRDKSFWQMHKKNLADAGIQFSRLRLGRVVLKEFFRALLNPGKAIEKSFGMVSNIVARRRLAGTGTKG